MSNLGIVTTSTTATLDNNSYIYGNITASPYNIDNSMGTFNLIFEEKENSTSKLKNKEELLLLLC